MNYHIVEWKNSCNINYSPNDNYKAIFGLNLKNSNKGLSIIIKFRFN